MSQELVKIKGSGQGLQLSFAKNAAYPEVRRELQAKLKAGSGFFLRGTLVQLPRNAFTEADRLDLQKLFHEYGLICRVLEKGAAAVPSANVQKKIQQATQQQAKAEEPKAEQMVVCNRTLRGGQEIRTASSVLVCGNVNPGAQIIAGGSIDIRGTCRGVVHAGANGDDKAFIIADRLMPTQIRIAHLIARAPDQAEQQEKPQHPERASIKNGQIVIEPIER